MYRQNLAARLSFVIFFLVCLQFRLCLSVDCEHEGFYSDHENCANYYLCKDGQRYYLSCGGTLKFNPENGKCQDFDEEYCKQGQTVFFPLNFQHTSNMLTNSTRGKPPKIICYISNWKQCQNKNGNIDKMICDKACYAFNALSEYQTSDISAQSTTCDKQNKIKQSSKLIYPQRKYKVVCYFTSWAWYYKSKGKFIPDNVDPSYCSHIIYAHAIFSNETFAVKPYDSWADVENGFYSKIAAMRSSGAKVMLMIGGWGESKSGILSTLISAPQNRKNFINSLIPYLDKWGFQGIEFDWQYPKCWQNNCGRGPATDPENFKIFIKELSDAFKKKGLLLSVVMSRFTYIIDVTYDAKTVSQYVDWITVHSHNYYTSSQGKTGHVGALYNNIGDNLNVNYTINYLLGKGIPAHKIVMAIPGFSNSLELSDSNDHGYNALTNGPGKTGEWTSTNELLSFMEVCNNVKNNGWTVVRDSHGRAGPYAYKGNQWASYDDMADIKRKADFIKDLGLGGAYFWTLAFDDFRNVCGCGKYPLLSALSHELRGTPKPNTLENCT